NRADGLRRHGRAAKVQSHREAFEVAGRPDPFDSPVADPVAIVLGRIIVEVVSSQPWFLRKHQDGSTFGPISFDQLSGWASTAQVAPHDLVSTDQQTWLKASMLTQLGMDWLVEVTSEHYYGPTTVGAIQEFIRLGDINADTFVINSCDGTRRQIREMPALFKTNAAGLKATATDAATEPAAAGISLRL